MKTQPKPTAKFKEYYRNDAEQIVKLHTLKNLGFRVAHAMINIHGYYTCMLDGKKTFVEL